MRRVAGGSSLGHMMLRRSAWERLFLSSTLTPSFPRYDIIQRCLSVLINCSFLFDRTVSATRLASLQSAPRLQSSNTTPVSMPCLRHVSDAQPIFLL